MQGIKAAKLKLTGQVIYVQENNKEKGVFTNLLNPKYSYQEKDFTYINQQKQKTWK